MKMSCLQAVLCLMIVSSHAQDLQMDPDPNASPNPRVNLDMSRILGSLVSKLYSNMPAPLHAPDESQVQEREASVSFLQEIRSGRHGSGPIHIYGRHMSHHGSRGSSHKLSGAASGGHKDHRNIVEVL